MASISTSCEAILLHKIIENIINQMLEPTTVYSDHHSYIKLSKKPVFEENTGSKIDSWKTQSLIQTWNCQQRIKGVNKSLEKLKREKKQIYKE